MATHRRTWQKREGRAAALFGALRQVGSGSGGRDDETCSDSRHPKLFLECKLRAKHSVVSLWDATKKLAAREKKVPVVILAEKGRPGQWLLVHSADLDALLIERLLAMTDEQQRETMAKLWRANETET